MYTRLVFCTLVLLAELVVPGFSRTFDVESGFSRTSIQSFDPMAATEKYLASVPPEQRQKSDAYFEGGYWIRLWGFFLGSAVQWVLLQRGSSAAMRDRAARLTRFRPLQTATYWVQYLIVTTLLIFPFASYTRFFREHQYGLATQTFGAWLGSSRLSWWSSVSVSCDGGSTGLCSVGVGAGVSAGSAIQPACRSSPCCSRFTPSR